MALPSSCQGHGVHSALIIAQSINALKPNWIHVGQEYVWLDFFVVVIFYIQGRRLHCLCMRVCQSMNSPVVDWKWQKEWKSVDHNMWTTWGWNQLSKAFMSEPMMQGMLGGTKDLRNKRGKVEKKHIPFIAWGLQGEIHFDVPATAKSPEAGLQFAWNNEALALCVFSAILPPNSDWKKEIYSHRP